MKKCTQAWPGGLKYGLLVECDREVHDHAPGHTGKHISKGHRMEWWGGKLSPREEKQAQELRERVS